MSTQKAPGFARSVWAALVMPVRRGRVKAAARFQTRRIAPVYLAAIGSAVTNVTPSISAWATKDAIKRILVDRRQRFDGDGVRRC